MENGARDAVRYEFYKLLRDDIGNDVDETPIAELGVDSLDFFELLYHLEEIYNIEFPIDSLDESVTLNDLVRVAQAQTHP